MGRRAVGTAYQKGAGRTWWFSIALRPDDHNPTGSRRYSAAVPERADRVPIDAEYARAFARQVNEQYVRGDVGLRDLIDARPARKRARAARTLRLAAHIAAVVPGPAKPDTKGLVYFVQAGTDGPVKIGFTFDMLERLANLQIANAAELRLLAAIPGTLAHERKLHGRFKALCVRGEWFRCEGDLRGLLDRLQETTAT